MQAHHDKSGLFESYATIWILKPDATNHLDWWYQSSTTIKATSGSPRNRKIFIAAVRTETWLLRAGGNRAVSDAARRRVRMDAILAYINISTPICLYLQVPGPPWFYYKMVSVFFFSSWWMQRCSSKRVDSTGPRGSLQTCSGYPPNSAVNRWRVLYPMDHSKHKLVHCKARLTFMTLWNV